MGQNADATLDAVFRTRHREITATLLREFGTHHLPLIEEALQDALLAALQRWDFAAPPDNPSGWLYTTARRRLLDQLRHQRIVTEHASVTAALHMDDTADSQVEMPQLEALDDEVLKLTFICAHPSLAPKTQLAMVLKHLCGLGTAAIAQTLLQSEAAVKKSLTRASLRLREHGVAFELPSGSTLHTRFDAVLRCLYAMFNEAYLSADEQGAVQESLGNVAIELAELCARDTLVPDPGKAHALAALMCFQHARCAARVDAEGQLIRLADQNRSLWNPHLLIKGFSHLGRSTASATRSSYHLQAGIAACHAAAANMQDTDWAQILELYDDLAVLEPSPIVFLNRAVAIAMTAGYAQGLEALQILETEDALRGFYLLPALQAEFCKALGDEAAARTHYQRALALVQGGSVRRFLRHRLQLANAEY